MVSRCAISILILSALGVPWALEQPSSSVLEFHPAMQFIAKKFSMHKAWHDLACKYVSIENHFSSMQKSSVKEHV